MFKKFSSKALLLTVALTQAAPVFAQSIPGQDLLNVGCDLRIGSFEIAERRLRGEYQEEFNSIQASNEAVLNEFLQNLSTADQGSFLNQMSDVQTVVGDLREHHGRLATAISQFEEQHVAAERAERARLEGELDTQRRALVSAQRDVQGERQAREQLNQQVVDADQALSDLNARMTRIQGEIDAAEQVLRGRPARPTTGTARDRQRTWVYTYTMNGQQVETAPKRTQALARRELTQAIARMRTELQAAATELPALIAAQRQALQGRDSYSQDPNVVGEDALAARVATIQSEIERLEARVAAVRANDQLPPHRRDHDLLVRRSDEHRQMLATIGQFQRQIQELGSAVGEELQPLIDRLNQATRETCSSEQWLAGISDQRFMDRYGRARRINRALERQTFEVQACVDGSQPFFNPVNGTLSVCRAVPLLVQSFQVRGYRVCTTVDLRRIGSGLATTIEWTNTDTPNGVFSQYTVDYISSRIGSDPVCQARLAERRAGVRETAVSESSIVIDIPELQAPAAPAASESGSSEGAR